MLFFEYSFLFVFLPAVLIAHVALPRALRNLWLLIASIGFYAFATLDFLPILLVSILVDYGVGRAMAAAERLAWRRALLTASVLINLGLLAYFKYSGLITTSLRELGLDSVPLLEAALPVGISFYTFQSMSYTIDLYRGRVPVSRSLVDFACFVTLFPQLIAGPIVRYEQLRTQLRERDPDLDQFAAGVALFIRGMAKKVILADTAGLLCNPLFEEAHPGAVVAWAGIGLYAMQIYFDFSGYSDMAIGLGRMLGFEFPLNFDSPYKAESFSDFWRRWHITLSRWLRDNLYIPLGGNRRGALRTYVNLLLTMLLGGLWHGASWNFLLWGGGHGLLLAIERRLGQGNPLLRAPPLARRLAVFLCVTLLWVPFRCDDLAHSGEWLLGMCGLGGGGGAVSGWHAAALIALLPLSGVGPNTGQIEDRFRLGNVALLMALFLLSVFLGLGREPAPFLYFRF